MCLKKISESNSKSYRDKMKHRHDNDMEIRKLLAQ